MAWRRVSWSVRGSTALKPVVILGADDVPEHVGILGTEGRRDHALVALDEIVGGDGVAVGPLGIGAEVESVAEAVG